MFVVKSVVKNLNNPDAPKASYASIYAALLDSGMSVDDANLAASNILESYDRGKCTSNVSHIY